MEILIGFALGVVVSIIFHEVMMRAVLRKLGIETREQLQRLLAGLDPDASPTRDDQDPRVQKVHVENINGRLYAYTVPEQYYIGQAESYAQLLDVLKDRLDTDAVDIQEEHHDS